MYGRTPSQSDGVHVDRLLHAAVSSLTAVFVPPALPSLFATLRSWGVSGASGGRRAAGAVGTGKQPEKTVSSADPAFSAEGFGVVRRFGFSLPGAEATDACVPPEISESCLLVKLVELTVNMLTADSPQMGEETGADSGAIGALVDAVGALVGAVSNPVGR